MNKFKDILLESGKNENKRLLPGWLILYLTQDLKNVFMRSVKRFANSKTVSSKQSRKIIKDDGTHIVLNRCSRARKIVPAHHMGSHRCGSFKENGNFWKRAHLFFIRIGERQSHKCVSKFDLGLHFYMSYGSRDRGNWMS